MADCFGLIYKATNKINGKAYIGQTVKSLRKRKRDHLAAAFRPGADFYFWRAIRKYGPENFKWEKLCECASKVELDKKEKYYITYYNTFENGYNLTLGGEGNLGWIPSEEIKKKISKSRRGKLIGKDNPFYGKKHTKETRRKMSKNHPRLCGKDNPNYGRIASEETRRKISKASKGRWLGREHTKIAKDKIRKARVQKWLVVFPDGHKEIIENMLSFCRKNDLSPSIMSMIASKKYRYKEYKGFRCKKIYDFRIERTGRC